MYWFINVIDMFKERCSLKKHWNCVFKDPWFFLSRSLPYAIPPSTASLFPSLVASLFSSSLGEVIMLITCNLVFYCSVAPRSKNIYSHSLRKVLDCKCLIQLRLGTNKQYFELPTDPRWYWQPLYTRDQTNHHYLSAF